MEFVLVPGAWAGSWLWSQVAKLLRSQEYPVHELTLSGLDTNSPKAEVNLSTHVIDVVSYIKENHLERVVLVGHSYSGLVVGQVASQYKKLVSQTVFVEAFLPVSGASLLDVSGLDIQAEKNAIKNNRGFWPAPTVEELSSQTELSPEGISLLATKQIPHPGGTVIENATLATPLDKLNATFIASSNWLSSSRQNQLLEQLKTNSQWQFYTLNGGHWPMLTKPEELTQLLISSTE